MLRESGHDVKGFFYNPNIHPYSEFTRRRETLVNFSKVSLLSLIIADEDYELERFLKATISLGRDRCLACYRIRLERAFERARKEKAEAVTTTLLYSKYQRHDAIAAIGKELSVTYELPFLYKDFREGWKEGQDESRQLGLYRQNYCGCIFSEYERFTAREKRRDN